MKQFRAKTLGDEGNMLRYMCKMVTRGNKILIDPTGRLTDRMRQNGLQQWGFLLELEAILGSLLVSMFGNFFLYIRYLNIAMLSMGERLDSIKRKGMNLNMVRFLHCNFRCEDCHVWITTWVRFSRLPFVLSHHLLWGYVFQTIDCC